MTATPPTPQQPEGVAGVDYPIKVAGGVWAPWVYPCAEWYPMIDFVKCPYPGFSAEILHYAMKAANFSYEIVPWDKIDHGDSWGSLVGYDDNGKPVFDGLIGMVANGTFDTILSSYGLSEIRMKTIDYSFPIVGGRQKMGYIMRRADASVDLNSASLLTEMFHPLVWGAFAGTFFLIITLLWLTRNFKLWALKRTDAETLVSKSGYTAIWDSICMIFIFFSILDEYHGVFGEGLLAGNVLMLCSGFLCLFLHTTYEGYLVTQMLKETSSQPFTGMRDLAPLIKSKKYRFLIYSTSDFWTTQVMNAEGGKYELMKEAIVKNPPVETGTRGYEKALDTINEDENVYYIRPGAQDMNFPAWAVGRCNIIFIPDADQGDPFIGYILTKGTMQSRKIFEVMAGMVPFMSYVDDKYYKFSIMGDKCDRRTSKIGPQPLKVRHYYGLLIIGIGGAITGTTCFLFEYFFAKVTDKPARDQKKRLAHNEAERRIAKLQSFVATGKARGS